MHLRCRKQHVTRFLLSAVFAQPLATPSLLLEFVSCLDTRDVGSFYPKRAKQFKMAPKAVEKSAAKVPAICLDEGADRKRGSVRSLPTRSNSSASLGSASERDSPRAPVDRLRPRVSSVGGSDTQPRQVVIDHQGAGKVVHKPDGTVVWEPAPAVIHGGPAHRTPSEGAIMVATFAGMLLTAGSMYLGFDVAGTEIENARKKDTCLSTRQLTKIVGNTVAATMAGMISGMTLGPVLAVRSVAGVLLRPALVGFAVHQGFGLIKRWRAGVVGIIRKLQSADMGKVLEALRSIIASASRNPRFANEFNRLAGVEVLLQRLSEMLPDSPLLHMLAHALEELLKASQDARTSLVAAGGVPRLVALLSHTNPVISGHALGALSCVADDALAQDAIREAGGASRLVQLLATSVAAEAAAAAPGSSSSALAVASSGSSSFDRASNVLPAVKLLQVLSLDPIGKAAIGEAGGVPVLLQVVSQAEARSPVQVEAVVALHNVLRGSADNQRSLATVPSASEILRGALSGFGPCWHPSKAELHSMLNVLARLQGAQEAGGFVVIQSQVAVGAPAAAIGPAGAIQVRL